MKIEECTCQYTNIVDLLICGLNYCSWCGRKLPTYEEYTGIKLECKEKNFELLPEVTVGKCISILKRYNLDCHVYARSTTAVFEICDFMNYDSGIVCLGLLEMEEQDEKAYRKKYETGKSGLNVHHNKMGD